MKLKLLDMDEVYTGSIIVPWNNALKITILHSLQELAELWRNLTSSNPPQ
jgi:hypothetical protein